MCQIDVLCDSIPEIGLYSRSKTNGPELESVYHFVSQKGRELEASTLKSDALFLIEPRIDSGYPDIVLLLYSKTFMDNWTAERSCISSTDLKVLSYINAVGSVRKDQIGTTLGFDEGTVERALSLLFACRMIGSSGRIVKRAKKTSYSGIRKVIAFEAKESNVRGAIDQAMRNTRFANESYVLLNSTHPEKTTLNRCQMANVGLIYGKDYSETIKPKPRSTSNSYITLLFNEWLGRRLALGLAHEI